MRVVVTGGTGFVGTALVEALAARGDEVVVLTRSREGLRLPSGVVAAEWNPSRSGPWQQTIDGAAAIVHLAGSPVAVRWTDEQRRRIMDSRVVSARLLVEAVGAAKDPPAIFVSASGTGYYGSDRPGETLTEESAGGDDFLAEVCRAWEDGAGAAAEHGARVAIFRFGIVLGRGGGALDGLILPGRLGVGRVGSGDNVMSWIHRADVVAMLLWSLDGDHAGAYNCTAPEPRTARELAAVVGRAISRPVVPAPRFALRLALGEAADVIAGSQRVIPARALAEGFTFAHPDLEDALASILG